eukprot:TRINITY_DN2159_c0_g2_i3.p1 TRINITY_DN2159_c0_g2~~TRINITY_DN2159_c0_g2_i3.p1  ORF type:complete len:247 (-),score=41.19 TRINITY_DN2159_c0_g2_i3:186-926(-)
MDKTAGNPRTSEMMMPLRIADIRNLSPTVKAFKMELTKKDSQRGSFLPGQWMDLYIPQIDEVGGYSMCSEPSKFDKDGVLDLAIKYSTWAPAHWMHTKASVNDELQFRFGGDYHYPNNTINAKEPHRLVLIAGGVGINPLISMALHASDIGLPVETHLLYSAKTEEELIFKNELDALTQRDSGFHVQYRVTNSEARIGVNDLEGFLSTDKPTYFYICGPAAMIKDVNASLLQRGVTKEKIFYELWT